MANSTKTAYAQQTSPSERATDLQRNVNITNILSKDSPLVTVEYQGNSTVVLRADEESLLLLNGNTSSLNRMRKTLHNNSPELYDSSELLKRSFFDRLQGKPFWIWNKDEHIQTDIDMDGDCCFNHIIGLPTKNGIEHRMYPYEKTLYDILESTTKHLWVKKATGLGITEFMLRYMAWLALKDNQLDGSQMCVVTGPRVDLAVALIDRMKRLFEPKAGIYFQDKETVLELNGIRIEAFPSHHLDAMRGLPNVSFILLDEADFFPIGQQQDARDVSERYIGKSNPYIVMVSTPNQPDGLFERIERESESKCLYKRLFLDYTYGLDTIYSRDEIDKAKTSPSFEREYNLMYGGHIGNVFSEGSIQIALKKGAEQYDPTNPKTFNEMVNPFAKKVMAVDPGWGLQLVDFAYVS
jgi:hypothetical protein